MILVDANSIAHQCKHSLGNLSWNEKKVGVIFGFFNQILSLAKIFDTNRFIFAWDSRKSLRTALFSDYKKQRRYEKSPEEKELDTIAYIQFDTIRQELLPGLGFVNNYMVEGFEADDLIASITFTNPNKEFFIISTDEDLYQLLSDNVRMYSIRKKQFYTNRNLWKEYGITPDEWSEVKSIAGCNTDGVPGVAGVGEKTACLYINRHLNVTHKSYHNIKKSGELIERNRKLVTLPFEGTPEIILSAKNNLSLIAFQDICNRYGFQSFLEQEKYKQWKEFIFIKGNNNGPSSC
jgi:DNA polymerase I